LSYRCKILNRIKNKRAGQSISYRCKT